MQVLQVKVGCKMIDPSTWAREELEMRDKEMSRSVVANVLPHSCIYSCSFAHWATGSYAM